MQALLDRLIIQKLSRSAQRALSRRFPTLFPDKDRIESLAFFHERDPEENRKTAPPDTETISVHALWAVEFYLPSQINQLFDGFKRLGWDRQDHLLATSEDLATWVSSLRATQRAGGWYNVGTIRRDGPDRPTRHIHKAALPEIVEYARCHVLTPTSSLTCVLMQFVFTDNFQLSLDNAVRQARTTITEEFDGGRSYIEPVHQKQRSVADIRSRMRNAAFDWFKENLPGVFCTQKIPDEFPTCEFTTTKEAELLSPTKPGRGEYLWILDLDFGQNAWEVTEIPGLKFTWPLARDRGTRFHAALVAREGAFSAEKLKSHGGEGKRGYTSYVDGYVGDFISRWSLIALLHYLQRQVNSIRDSTSMRIDTHKKSMRLLSDLSAMSLLGVDIAGISLELAQFAEHRGLFEHNLVTMYPVDVRFHKDNSTFASDLRAGVRDRAQWLQKADQSVRELLIQYGSLLATRENIRLQKSMGRLTWLVLVLSVLIPILAAIGADHDGRRYLFEVVRSLSASIIDHF